MPSGDVPTLDEIAEILVFRCGNIICHMPPPYTPPDLSSTGVELRDTLLEFKSSKCEGEPLVVPGNPEASVLLRVVNHECGSFYMPPDTYDNFTPEEMSAIAAWIAAGAPL